MKNLSLAQRSLLVGVALVAAALSCSAPSAQGGVTPSEEVAQAPIAEAATATPYVVTATPESAVVQPPSGDTTGGTTGDSTGGTTGGADCPYDSVYVADLTIPDGTEVETGAAFTKTWRVQNNGCQTWPGGTSLIFVSGDAMSGPSSVPVPETAPTGTQDISVNLTAPASEGTYQAYWQLRTPDGIQFGDKIFVKIKAKAPAPAPGITPTFHVVIPPGGFQQILTVKFNLSYAGVKKHCVLFTGQQIWVKVKNTGNVKVESSYTKLEMPEGTQIGEGTSNNPFLPSFACGTGAGSLAADDTAWMIVGGSMKSFVPGASGKATVKLCGLDDQGGFCATKTVSFTVD